MAEEFDLIAEFRDDGQGKGASRRLRREGKVPAVLYGGGRAPRALAFDHNKLMQQSENESFYSSILSIQVGDKSQAAIVKDLQRHPAKHQIMHIDLQRVVEDEEIRMHVPIHFKGGDVAPGVKIGGGVVSHLMTDVEVVCLPRYLPEYLEVDISGLELNAMLHLSDIGLPEGVALPELAQGPEHDHAIVSIHVIKIQAVEEVPTEAPAAGEVPAMAQSTDMKKVKPATDRDQKSAKRPPSRRSFCLTSAPYVCIGQPHCGPRQSRRPVRTYIAQRGFLVRRRTPASLWWNARARPEVQRRSRAHDDRGQGRMAGQATGLI